MSEPGHISRAGTRFGPYQLQRLLGKGGMGEVYEAYDTVKDRTVAVKLLPESLAKNLDYQERFRRESRAAARLQEPHVIPIHDWGEIDDVLYIDMRLVPGEDLRAVLRRETLLSPARAVGIIGQIAAALDAAHADHLVHRDVKPENILLTANDFAYLVDFGIANNETDPSLTKVGTAIGSYAYMAPERFDSGGVTKRADIYSLACVLHECLTGAPPYPTTSVSVLIMSHVNAPPSRPGTHQAGITPGLDAVVVRGLAKNPADRFESAGDFARAAQQALIGTGPDGVYIPAPPTVPNAPVFGERNQPPQQMPPGGPRNVPPPLPPPPNWQQPNGQPYAPPTKSSGSRIAVGALLVVLLVLGVTFGWIYLTRSDDGSTNARDGVTTSESPGESTNPTPTTAEQVSLPSGAQPCDQLYPETSAYTTSAKGTLITSCPFAEEVRVAYAGSGPPGESRPVVAISPVTQQAYTMDCTASGPLVTCTGGDNAVVYVY